MLFSALLVIAVIVFLIGVNGIYVAAEFSTISASRPRLAQRADEGNTMARYVLRVLESPHSLDTYIAACQLGITLSSLVLGFFGQAQILALFEPTIAQLAPSVQLIVRSFATTGILLTLTIFQVILGELMPKNVGVQHPEQLATATAPFMRWSVAAFRPLIWLFNGSGQWLLRLLGRQAVGEPSHIHSPEEILILVEESGAGGVLDAEERRLLVNTLYLRKLRARQVMIPRTHMLAAPVDQPIHELLALLADSPYSRLPLFEESVDGVVGVIHLKDLLCAVHGAPDAPTPAPRQLMHTVIHVPEAAPVEEVMTIMQTSHVNIAIVINEYGGTAGMITFEDLVEEIFGEFQDEFDVENPPLELRPNNRLRVRGDVLINEVNIALNLQLPTDTVETIGGLVIAKLQRLPNPGDIAMFDELPIRVDRVVANSVAAVSLPLTAEQALHLRKLDL
jgi:CBS domain containing-hemolysin-like protein